MTASRGVMIAAMPNKNPAIRGGVSWEETQQPAKLFGQAGMRASSSLGSRST
jgi:hypothetical protein